MKNNLTKDCLNLFTYKSSKKAFTLIELLVVIAIIALLVSILLPSLTKAKDLAKSVVCMSNQKSIGTMFAFYINAGDGVFPSHEPDHPSLKFWDAKILDASQANADTPDAAILHCPIDTLKRSDEDYKRPRSYSYNPVLCNFNGDYSVRGAVQAANDGMPVEDISHPDNVAAIIEFYHKVNIVGNGDYVVWANPIWEHMDKTNLLFADSHVAKLEKK